jgi:hypothetical protein
MSAPETPRTWTMSTDFTPTKDEIEANRNEFAKLLSRLRDRRLDGSGEGDPVKVAVEVRDAAKAGLVAAREKGPVDTERERMLDLLRRWAGYDEPGAVRTETARLLREHGRLGTPHEG